LAGPVKKTKLLHTFIFAPAFPLGRVAREAALGLEIPHSFQQNLAVVLALHQDGTKQGRRYIHATWPLVSFWPAFLWVLPAGLASPNSHRSSLSRDRMIVAEIFRFGEDLLLDIHGFSNCPTARFAAKIHAVNRL